MCINKDETPDRRARVLARKRFVHNLAIMVIRGSFSFDIYKYARHGSLSDWIVLFKFAHGQSYKSQSVIEAIASAAQ